MCSARSASAATWRHAIASAPGVEWASARRTSSASSTLDARVCVRGPHAWHEQALGGCVAARLMAGSKAPGPVHSWQLGRAAPARCPFSTPLVPLLCGGQWGEGQLCRLSLPHLAGDRAPDCDYCVQRRACIRWVNCCFSIK